VAAGKATSGKATAGRESARLGVAVCAATGCSETDLDWWALCKRSRDAARDSAMGLPWVASDDAGNGSDIQPTEAQLPQVW